MSRERVRQKTHIKREIEKLWGTRLEEKWTVERPKEKESNIFIVIRIQAIHPHSWFSLHPSPHPPLWIYLTKWYKMKMNEPMRMNESSKKSPFHTMNQRIKIHWYLMHNSATCSSHWSFSTTLRSYTCVLDTGNMTKNNIAEKAHIYKHTHTPHTQIKWAMGMRNENKRNKRAAKTSRRRRQEKKRYFVWIKKSKTKQKPKAAEEQPFPLNIIRSGPYPRIQKKVRSNQVSQ